MIRGFLVFALLAGLGLTAAVLHAQTSASATVAVPGPGPQELIQQSAQAMLRDLDRERDAYRKDPKKMRALIDRHLLVHFDVDYAARMVLGKHWRDATEVQRQRFIEAFYQSLLRNYGDAMADFTADRLKILPFKGEPGATSATVRTEVKRSSGPAVPVNYTLRATPEGWKAWDVTIEGISYVRNYRTDFGAEIEQRGLDAVIRRLEAQNASGKPDAAPGTGRTARGAG